MASDNKGMELALFVAQLIALFATQAPAIAQAWMEAGITEPSNLDWAALLPRSREELEAEVGIVR